MTAIPFLNRALATALLCAAIMLPARAGAAEVVMLQGFVSVTKTCAGVTPPRVSVVRKPRFGHVEIMSTNVRPTFAPGSPYYHCNRVERRGTGARYIRTRAGKADSLTLKIVYHDGEVQYHRRSFPARSPAQNIWKQPKPY